MGTVDLLGNAYEAPCISTGYGNHIAIVSVLSKLFRIKVFGN